MKRKQESDPSLLESKKAKTANNLEIPHHSSWFNSAVLLNIYTFLPFRDVLTFRLVNHTINQELHISSSSTDELFFMNRLSKMKREFTDKSCEFLHGCLMKVNAEIRNCLVLDHEMTNYFHHLSPYDSNFSLLCSNESYSNLFKNGNVSFNSYLGGVFTQAQGGRCELKIAKKSANQQGKKEFMIFTQHFVYGPNTRVDNLERKYDLKVRDSNNQEKNLVWYLNYYYTWEDEPLGTGTLDFKAIKKVMEQLDIPSEWDWKEFLKFLMTCASAKDYCCEDPAVDENTDVLKSMIKELKSTHDNLFTIKPEHVEVQEGLKSLEEIIKPIIQSVSSYSHRMEYFEIIRSQILKLCARTSQNVYNFDSNSNWDNFDITINEPLFQKLKSKLKYYTFNECCHIGFTEYIQEERICINAMFETANGKLTEVSFQHNNCYTFTDQDHDISLKMNDANVSIPTLVENILGFDWEQLEDEELMLKDISKCLLKLFGQCHRIYITESTDMTFTSKYYSNSIKDAVGMLEELDDEKVEE